MIPAARLLIISFLFLNINYFHCGFTKLFHAIFTSIYIMLIFYAVDEFVVDEFSGLFLLLSMFFIIHSIPA